jgi:hypothetical protein
MQSLLNKKIVLGISGGIAAYKAPELARQLMQEGASVQVVMTEAAQQFVTPVTMQGCITAASVQRFFVGFIKARGDRPRHVTRGKLQELNRITCHF